MTSSTNNRGPNSNQRRAVYTNGDLNQYDGHVTALAFRFFNQVGCIDFSPINSEFIGKEAKKGDKVYDHENKASIYISGNNAIALLEGIRILRDSVDNADENSAAMRQVKVDFSHDKSVTLYAPGRNLKGIKADTAEKYILAAKNDDLNMYHILQNNTITFVDADKETIEHVINSGLEALIKFLEQVIALSTGAYRQGAALAAPRGGSSDNSQQKKAAFGAALDEDEFDDEDDDEVEDKPASTKRAPKALAGKRGGTRRSSASALEEDFDEDDE